MGHERLLRQPTGDKRTVKTKKLDLVYEDPLAVNKTIRGPHPQTVAITHQLFRDPHKQTVLIRYFRVYGRSSGVDTASAGPRALSRIPTPGVGVGLLEEPGEAATGLKRGRSAAKKTLSPAKPLNPSPSPLASALIRATCSGWRRSRLHDDPPQARVAAARHCRRRRRLFFSP